jgi:hypothetical protein
MTLSTYRSCELSFAALVLLRFFTLSPSHLCLAAEPPNVLIIMADDCTFNDLPLYGGQNARTPNIDRLASQGRRSIARTSARQCVNRVERSCSQDSTQCETVVRGTIPRVARRH